MEKTIEFIKDHPKEVCKVGKTVAEKENIVIVQKYIDTRKELYDYWAFVKVRLLLP